MREYIKLPADYETEGTTRSHNGTASRKKKMNLGFLPIPSNCISGIAIHFNKMLNGLRVSQAYTKNDLLTDYVRLALQGFADVPLLLEHREDQKIGKIISLRLDDDCLRFQAELDKFSVHYPTVASGLKMGKLGFSASILPKTDDEPYRLIEISVTSDPADKEASCTSFGELELYHKQIGGSGSVVRSGEITTPSEHRGRREPLWRRSDQCFAW